MATVINYLTPSRSLVDRDIRTIIASKLQLDASNISGGLGLGDIGFDSLALSDLAEAIEEKFAVPIPNRMLPATLTIEQLVSLIAQKQEAGEDVPYSTIMAEPAD